MCVRERGAAQGLGYEALAAVLAAVRPSHAVLMQAPAARRNLAPEPFWLLPPPAGALPPPPPVIVQLPAADAPPVDAGVLAGGRERTKGFTCGHLIMESGWRMRDLIGMRRSLPCAFRNEMCVPPLWARG